MEEEVDEFGIPIKKDEFGIPVKRVTAVSKPTQPQTDILGHISDIVQNYNVPVDAEPTPFQNAISRGSNLADQAMILSPFNTPKGEQIGELAKLQQENTKLPASKEYQQFNQSKSTGEALKNLVHAPLQIIGELTVESMTSLLKYGAPRIGVGAAIGAGVGSVVPGIGTAAGAGAGVVTGMADASLGLEYSGAFIESLQKAGVDVTDPDSLKKAFSDDSIISEARSHALKKGIPIAIFDYISGGIAGKVVTKPATSLIGKAAVGAAEFGIQAGMGGAGELAGEVTAGEDINAPAILSEMIGELGTTPIEVGVAAATFNRNQRVATQTINEVADTGDPQLNSEIDAAAEIDPVDKQVLLEKKLTDVVQETQKEQESKEKLEDAIQEQKTEGVSVRKQTTNSEGVSGENGQEKAASQSKEKEVKPSETPEYKQAVQRVEDLQKKFTELDISENADELLFDLREARQALQKIAGQPKDTRKKTSIQKQIEDATGVTKPEKSVKMTPGEAIKHQVQTFYKGVEKGVKKGKELTNDLVAKVQTALKEYPLTTQQTSQILTKVRKTNLFTPGSVSKLNTFIDKVSTDAQYAEDLSVSQDLQQTIKKKSKTKVESIPRNYKSIAKDFGRIKPEDVDNLSEYQAFASGVVGGFADPKTTKYNPINESSVRDYINRITEANRGKEAQRVRDEFGFGDEVTDEEIEKYFLNEGGFDDDEYAANKDEAKRKAVRDKILQTAEFSQLALDNVTSEEGQTVIDNLKKAPLDQLSDGQLVEFVRMADNIVENDDFSNTGRIEAMVEAVNNANELLKLTRGKKGEIGIIKGALYNVPMMFNAIYSNSEKASKVQLYSGLEDVYNGGSRVENQEHQLYEDFKNEANRTKNKYGKTPLDAASQVRRGVFGTLVRFPIGADPTSTLTQSKQIVQESIRRLEGNKDRVEIARDAASAYEPFKDAQTVEEVFDIMKKVDPEGLDMWKFFNDQFNTKVKGRLKKNAEQIFNEEFVEEENYTPKVFEIVDSAQSGDLDTPRAFTSDLPSKPKQSKTAIKATNALPAGRALNFEFDNNMFRKFRESMYDIETSKPRMLFREFMRLPVAAEILGGQNKQKLTETYRKSEEVQRGIGRDYSDASKLLDEVTGALRSLGYTAALGSVDQFVKQYVPVATNTIWNLGGDSGLFFAHIPKEADNLFNLYTIGQRGRRLGGAERGESIKYKIQSQYRNKLLKSINKIHKLTDKGASIFMYSLTKGDVNVAKRSWAAYYLKYLRDNGVDLKTVDLSNEHLLQGDKIRREAASFAEQKVKETQVVSNPSELAKLLRTAPGAENWIKNIFIPFSTFSVNTKVRVIENIRQLRTNENKPEAYRALAGTMTEIALYSTIKYYLLSQAYGVIKAGIENAFGFDGEDDDKDFRFKQWYSSIFKDFFPFSIGTMGESKAIEAANRMSYLIQNPDMTYDEWQKETKGGTFYTYKGDSQSFDLGLYSVGLDRIQETVQDTKASLTGNTVVSNYFGEKEISLDADQQRFISVMAMLDAISSFGFMDAGLYNTLKRIKREQLRGSGESSGSTRPVSRPQPRPRLHIPAHNLH